MDELVDFARGLNYLEQALERSLNGTSSRNEPLSAVTACEQANEHYVRAVFAAVEVSVLGKEAAECVRLPRTGADELVWFDDKLENDWLESFFASVKDGRTVLGIPCRLCRSSNCCASRSC